MSHNLTFGSHQTPEDGLCLLEACALIAGEPHSDRPNCVCPVLSAFLRKVNDLAFHDDETRTRVLSPLVVALVLSRATEDVERARTYALADSTVREMLPLALKYYGFAEDSALFASLPTLTPETLQTCKAEYEAAFRHVQVEIDQRPPHLSGLLTIAFRAASGCLKALSQMTGPLWSYHAEEVALCAAHAYSWISDESDESEPHAEGLAEATYDLTIALVQRALLSR